MDDKISIAEIKERLFPIIGAIVEQMFDDSPKEQDVLFYVTSVSIPKNTMIQRLDIELVSAGAIYPEIIDMLHSGKKFKLVPVE